MALENNNLMPPLVNINDFPLILALDDIQTQNCCSICLVDFSESTEVRKLPCQHIFHDICIRLWTEKNLSCPFCRQVFPLSHLVVRYFNMSPFQAPAPIISDNTPNPIGQESSVHTNRVRNRSRSRRHNRNNNSRSRTRSRMRSNSR